MPKTCRVTLTVELPNDQAFEAARLSTEDPELLARIISYGLMRRIVYGHLRQQPDEPPVPAHFPGAKDGPAHLFAEERPRA